MKKILFPLCLVFGFRAGAQDLALKIPRDADFVLSVKGDHFLDLMSAGDFDKSVLGKKILEEISEERGGRNTFYKSVNDFGINLAGTMYYYTKVTDSITYHCFLVPLADVHKFEQLFKDRKPGSIEVNGDTKRLYSQSEGSMLQWTPEYAYLVAGNLNTHFIRKDSAMAERYGIKEVSLSDFSYDRDSESGDTERKVKPVVVSSVTLADPSDPGYDVAPAIAFPDYDGRSVGAVMPPPPPPPSDPADGPPQQSARGVVSAPPVEEAPEIAVAPVEAVPVEATPDVGAAMEDPNPVGVVEVPAPPVNADQYVDSAKAEVAYPDNASYPVVAAPAEDNYYPSYDNEAYGKAYEAERKIEKDLARQWTDRWTTSTAAITDINQSVLSNKAYVQSLDKAAAAQFFVADMPQLFGGLLSSYYYSPKLLWGNYLKDYASASGKLYLGEKEMRMVADVELDDKRAASFKKIYRHKLNSKFADYVNMDKAVGFISASMDMEAYLDELPSWFSNNYYSSILGFTGDETGIAAELFSLLLDEKAISKVIKGDALFVITNVGPKEHDYISYEYDEDNYERKQVVKKKTETLPDVLFMASSDDTHLLERLLAYGINRKVITLKNGIYSLDGKALKRSNPFDCHLLIKDGIVFCGTSLSDIEAISSGRFAGKMTKEQRKMLLNSNMTAYFSPANLAGKLPYKEFGGSRSMNQFNTFMGNAGDMYIRSSGIRKNRMSTEMVAEVPQGNTNSLQYFINLIDKVDRQGRSSYNEADED